MEKHAGMERQPMTQERILLIMMALTFGVSGIFFIKNLLTRSMQGVFVIGACLLAFTAIVVVMNRLRISQRWKQFVISNCLVGLVFLISANSGTYYSDDFTLFLAVIGLGGMYLDPSITLVQTGLSTVALVVLYVINPAKADPLGQFIMCVVLMDVAAFTFFLLIRRGGQFIRLSEAKAEQANRLLDSIRDTRTELEQSYVRANRRLDEMRESNHNLAQNTRQLQQGSEGIQTGSRELEQTFAAAHTSIRSAGSQIAGLDEDIRRVEWAMAESSARLTQMGEQMEQVSSAITAAQAVFEELQQQTREISRLTDQMQNIAFNTTILALNASVEAARAGEYGVGFTVVANEVQRLATESESCTGRVGIVVGQINRNIEQTAQRMEDSAKVIGRSRITMGAMENGFQDLEDRFDGLHRSIAQQSDNVRDIDREFGQLEHHIGEMNSSSLHNREAVEAIVEAIRAYQKQMEQVVADSRRLQQLSAAMVDGPVR